MDEVKQQATQGEGWTAESARQLLQKDRQQRLAACRMELDQVLGRHMCRLTARPVITEDGRLAAEVQLVAQDGGV